MPKKTLPRYSIYIPSKGRADKALTADVLMKDGIPFQLVVEPQEEGIYRARYGKRNVLVLPFHDLGSSIPARNWIIEHSIAEGKKRHWQLDDNICRFARLYAGKHIPCEAGVALSICEDFTDRYEEIAIAGLNYEMFGFPKHPPVQVNCHVYSCSLILNSIPFRWRGKYNEDTDFCLQALAGGWNTILVMVFMAHKIRTMTMKGGNTDELYAGDGRLRMARALERMWPGVVEVKRRWGRPQHRINWGKFKRPLVLGPGVKIPKGVDERGMRLEMVKTSIRSLKVKSILKNYGKADRKGRK